MATMTAATVRDDHGRLREHVEHIRLAAREIPVLSPEERFELRSRVLDFLDGSLIPHAAAEETGLYREAGRLLGSPRATATMTRDHEAIRNWIDALSECNLDDTDELQRLLYGLYALISVHFWKEEVEYVPLVEGNEPVLVHEP